MGRNVLKVAGLMFMLVGMASLANATPPLETPEIDGGMIASALTLLSGGLMVISGRRRKA